MPIYEFECEFGHRTELFMKFSDFRESIICRQCQKVNCTHQVKAALIPSKTSPPKFVKGSGGFYSPTTPE
jgi:putative FmdB family regulatory protein